MGALPSCGLGTPVDAAISAFPSLIRRITGEEVGGFGPGGKEELGRSPDRFPKWDLSADVESSFLGLVIVFCPSASAAFLC